MHVNCADDLGYMDTNYANCKDCDFVINKMIELLNNFNHTDECVKQYQKISDKQITIMDFTITPRVLRSHHDHFFSLRLEYNDFYIGSIKTEEMFGTVYTEFSTSNRKMIDMVDSFETLALKDNTKDVLELRDTFSYICSQFPRVMFESKYNKREQELDTISR